MSGRISGSRTVINVLTYIVKQSNNWIFVFFSVLGTIVEASQRSGRLAARYAHLYPSEKLSRLSFSWRSSSCKHLPCWSIGGEKDDYCILRKKRKDRFTLRPALTSVKDVLRQLQLDQPPVWRCALLTGQIASNPHGRFPSRS